MPDKKSKEKKKDDADAAGEDGGKGGKGKLLPAIVLSVGLLGAGYFLGGGGGGGSAAPVAEATTEAEPAEEEHSELGKLISLDAVNVNLADGHFLRIAVTLELTEEKTEHFLKEASHDKSYSFPTAPASDMVLTTFSGRAMEDLSSAEGREAARLALVEAIDEAYHGEIHAVYLTEFVMQ